MVLRLLQHRDPNGCRAVIAATASEQRVVKGVTTTRELAMAALAEGRTLVEAVQARGLDREVDLESALEDGRLLAPIDHDDPAHVILTGTGLTHLGSAQGRDQMHKASETVTDSMRMFRDGVAGGKPQAGAVGQQPEWFFKGDGSHLVGPEGTLAMPAFALDGGEEPELAGIYLIGPDGSPHRLGMCLANEFSDHVTEKHNYLWLAHSKLRQASLGAELLTGPPPADVRGASRILRHGRPLWEKPFLTGERNMSHSIANLEHHHFKYAMFRRPGDIHVHFFGTATLSFADGIRTEVGDVFEISAPPFHLPLRNTLALAPESAFKASSL